MSGSTRASLQDAEHIIETARAMADAARAETLPRFRTALGVDNKRDGVDGVGFDPVTEADREAEVAMRAVLAERRPQDGVHGEELGRAEGVSGLTWVIDPVDGTRAFLIGAPVWGTLIAAVAGDGPLFGIIDQPWTGERWEGGLGHANLASPHGTADLGVRGTRVLDGALLCTTFPEVGTEAERAAFVRVAERARLVRYGMDCYAYGLLAAGHVDLVIEAGLHAYDICAPIAVVEAAGGIVTNWEGGPAHAGGRAIAAATAELHAAALDLLRG